MGESCCFCPTWWITAHACSSEMGAVKLARICCRERQPPGSKLQPAHPPFPAALPSILLGHDNPRMERPRPPLLSLLLSQSCHFTFLTGTFHPPSGHCATRPLFSCGRDGA